jgi:hypothetical protein
LTKSAVSNTRLRNLRAPAECQRPEANDLSPDEATGIRSVVCHHQRVFARVTTASDAKKGRDFLHFAVPPDFDFGPVKG